jgi:hypothetical protein
MKHKNDKDISMTLQVGHEMTPVEKEQFLDFLFSLFVRDYEGQCSGEKETH